MLTVLLEVLLLQTCHEKSNDNPCHPIYKILKIHPVLNKSWTGYFKVDLPWPEGQFVMGCHLISHDKSRVTQCLEQHCIFKSRPS